MRTYIAFTKKEFLEVLRTYKLFLMGIVFVILGMMNPLTAKLTPMLLESFMPKGILITLTEPTALDSWMQFYKNVPQMGLIVLVIVFSGSMANEFSKGTLIPVLTKGLSRKTVILSKFTMATCIWTVSYFMCFFISYAYTVYFWPEDSINNLLFSVSCLWLFGILLLSVMILGQIVCKSNYGTLLFTGIFVVLLFLVNIIPKAEKYSPLRLASKNSSLLTMQMDHTDFLIPILISCLLSILFLFCATFIFNKKQI